MEKSMIQDLRNSSSTHTMKNTFTTSFQDNNMDLRRSKISNLPSYKKSDLSDRLPFVVVFQTIEIQRLSQEIETLRVELKDSQRQAFNCQSYEIQIRQLTDQCHNYDLQLSQYKDEVEKLNEIAQQLYDELEAWRAKYQHLDPMITEKYQSKIEQCESLEQELEKWRNRYRALQTSKDKELQDLKLAMESQRQSMLDRELRQLTIKFQTERDHLQNQIRKLQQVNLGKDQQITTLSYEIQALKIENDANQQANYRLRELDSKVNKLTDQNIQLNEILRRKQETIEQQQGNENYLKKLISQLERQNKQTNKQVSKIPNLQNQLNDCKIKLSRLENDYESALERADTVPLLESQIRQIQMEKQRLGSMIKEKISQIAERDRQIQRLKGLIEESRKNQEIIPVLQRKIVQMNYESDRMGEQLKGRLVEIQNAKNKVNSLEKGLKAYEDAQPQKRRLQQNYRRQLKQLDANQRTIEQMKKQLDKIPHLEDQLRGQMMQKKEYQGQIERLNRVINQKSLQVEKFINKCEHLSSEIQKLSSLQRQLENYKIQNNKMTQQIDRLAGNIKNKSNQLENLKKLIIQIQQDVVKYKGIEKKLQASLTNTDRLMQQLTRTKDELQKCENNLLQCQFRLRETKSSLIEINQQKQLVMRNLKIKTQEYEASQQQIRKLQMRNKELDLKMAKAKEQLQTITKKLQEKEESVRSEKNKNKQLQRKCQQLQGSIEKIKIKGYFPVQFKSGFQKIKKSCAMKEQEIKKMKRKQNQLEKVIANVSVILDKCYKKYEKGYSSFQLLNEKINKSFEYIDRISKLEEENNCLKSDNCELESQIKLMNLEIADLEKRRKSTTQVSQFTIAPTSLIHVTTRKTFQSSGQEDRERQHFRTQKEQLNKSYLTFQNKSLSGTSRVIETANRTTSNYQQFKSKFEHPPRSSSRSIRTKITSAREPLEEAKYSYRG